MSIPTLNLKGLADNTPDRSFMRSTGITPLRKKKSTKKLTQESDSENDGKKGLDSSIESVPDDVISPTKMERRATKRQTVAIGTSSNMGDRSARLRALGIKPVLSDEQQKEIAKLKASARGTKMIVKAAPQSSKQGDDDRIGGSDIGEIQSDSHEESDGEDHDSENYDGADIYQETQVTQTNDSARNYQGTGAQLGTNGELKLTRLATDFFTTPAQRPSARTLKQMPVLGGPSPRPAAEAPTAADPKPQAAAIIGPPLVRGASFREFGRSKSKVGGFAGKGAAVVNPGLFRKDSRFSVFWNSVVLICILLDLIIIPLELSSQDVEYIGWFSYVTLTLIQICYLADIYINFNRTYYDQQVREVADPAKIRLRYFESYDFMVDLFSCAPILAYRKIFGSTKGYNQLFLLIRIIKALKIKTILIEFHQRFYVSSKLYFLGYLISVLTIVEPSDSVASGDLYLALCNYQPLHATQGTAITVSCLLRRNHTRMSRRSNSQGDDVASPYIQKHRA